MAMLVLPAPVGAQTRMFSLLVKAVGKMRLWILFSCLQHHVGFLKWELPAARWGWMQWSRLHLMPCRLAP